MLLPKGREKLCSDRELPSPNKFCRLLPYPWAGLWSLPCVQNYLPEQPGDLQQPCKGNKPSSLHSHLLQKAVVGRDAAVSRMERDVSGASRVGGDSAQAPITSVFFWMLEHPSRPPMAPSSQKGRVQVPRPRSRGPTPSSCLDSCSVRPEPEPMLAQAWLCDLPAPGALLAMPDPWTPLSPQGLGQENGPGRRSSPELASAEGSAARLVVSSLARVQPQTPISQLALSFQLKLPVSYHFHSLPLQQCRKLALNSPCEAAWWQLN